jgi:hypothetical protein
MCLTFPHRHKFYCSHHSCKSLLSVYIFQVADFQSEQSNRQAEVLYVLTFVTILIAPIQLLTGIYGMNFAVMPELEWKFGYAYFWGLSLSLMAFVGGGIWRMGWLDIKSDHNKGSNNGDSGGGGGGGGRYGLNGESPNHHHHQQQKHRQWRPGTKHDGNLHKQHQQQQQKQQRQYHIGGSTSVMSQRRLPRRTSWNWNNRGAVI